MTDLLIAFTMGLVLGGLPHSAQAAALLAGVVITFGEVVGRKSRVADELFNRGIITAQECRDLKWL